MYRTFIACLALLFTFSLRADTIVFHNGDEVEGTILEKDELKLTLEVEFGTMVVPMTKVRKIEVDTPEKIEERQRKKEEAAEFAKLMEAEGKVLYKGKWVTEEAKKVAEEKVAAEKKKKKELAEAAKKKAEEAAAKAKEEQQRRAAEYAALQAQQQLLDDNNDRAERFNNNRRSSRNTGSNYDQGYGNSGNYSNQGGRSGGIINNNSNNSNRGGRGR